MDKNLETYLDENVIAYYEKYEGLQKPEKTIFNLLETQISKMNMLDIGIGAGRTTRYFAPLVKQYTGVDYAQGMIDSCIKNFSAKFPDAVFLQADARHLEKFPENSFDLVLFSFNGIDYIQPEERKTTFLQIKRVLKKGGIFCFSTHNLISLLNIRGFEWRLNIPSAIKRAFEVRKIKKINNRQLSEAPYADYLVINDGAHDFTLQTCYYRPSYQAKQLEETGFVNTRIYNHTEGDIFNVKDELNSGQEKWLYYLSYKF